jgi:hypothetical protein
MASVLVAFALIEGIPQPDKCGKRDERAASGNRVDGAGDGRGNECENVAHAAEEYNGMAKVESAGIMLVRIFRR